MVENTGICYDPASAGPRKLKTHRFDIIRLTNPNKEHKRCICIPTYTFGWTLHPRGKRIDRLHLKIYEWKLAANIYFKGLNWHFMCHGFNRSDVEPCLFAKCTPFGRILMVLLQMTSWHLLHTATSTMTCTCFNQKRLSRNLDNLPYS